jgi:hypothetical protein
MSQEYQYKPPSECPWCKEDRKACKCDPGDKAGLWLSEYLIAQDEIFDTCSLDSFNCVPDEVWNSHCDFVAACMKAGVNPSPFADALFEQAKIYHEFFEDLL